MDRDALYVVSGDRRFGNIALSSTYALKMEAVSFSETFDNCLPDYTVTQKTTTLIKYKRCVMFVTVDASYCGASADRCEVVNTSAAVTCHVTVRLRGHSAVI